MNKITTKVFPDASEEVATHIGIDLAKSIFAIHGINAAGKPILVNGLLGLEKVIFNSYADECEPMMHYIIVNQIS